MVNPRFSLTQQLLSFKFEIKKRLIIKITYRDHMEGKIMKKRIISLSRVSTVKQSETGVSLAEQRRQIKQYCDCYGYEVVAEIEDVGSGSDINREGLQTALSMLDNNLADGICVVRIDRIARSLLLFQTLLANYFTNSGNLLISVQDHFDSSSPTSVLVMNILSSVAQHEHTLIKTRIKESLHNLKINNKRTGTVKFGYDADADNNLVKNESEQSVIRRLKRLRKKGLSFQKIAVNLLEKGFTNRKGKMYDQSFLRRLHISTQS